MAKSEESNQATREIPFRAQIPKQFAATFDDFGSIRAKMAALLGPPNQI
ncbi:MAG: hypothetical protein IJ412_06520 [Oscillospiraceae bacterium]|nr:hypothetical protein [Oscillospiraceae bacterium]